MRTQPLVILIGTLILPQTSAQAQFGRSFSKPFEAAIQDSMDRANVPGLAISIVHNGKEVYAHAFGVSNVDTKAPLVTADLFHWASVTKPFVATAAMQLVEQGKLDLDAPVTDYLPYFKMNDPAYMQITPRLLLTHTAGMPDVSNYEWDKPQYDDEALERWVREIGERKLIFPPTTSEQYSNIGFEVMGDVIAKVSGMSFEDFVARNIFRPLKMNTATLLVKETDPKDRVSPHTASRRVAIVRDLWPYNRRHAPSSTLIANVHDLARWAIANLNHGSLDDAQMLKEDAYAQLWKPTVDAAPNRGLSWQIGTYKGHRLIQHQGSDQGFRTGLFLLPDLNLGVAIATNTDKAPVTSFLRKALDSAIAATAD